MCPSRAGAERIREDDEIALGHQAAEALAQGGIGAGAVGANPHIFGRPVASSPKGELMSPTNMSAERSGAPAMTERHRSNKRLPPRNHAALLPANVGRGAETSVMQSAL